MSIVGGIISGVGSLLGGLGSSAMNNKAVQDTNKANMEIAKYQAQWQQQENATGVESIMMRIRNIDMT